MNKKSTGFWILIWAVLSAGFASALIRPDVRIMDYSIQPALTPGGQTQLEIQLQNVGNDECADLVSVQIAPISPLNVQGPDTHFLDRICKKDGPKNVTFSLVADQSASLSNNPVSITVAYQSDYAAPYSTSQSANVMVQGTAQLRAQITSSNPTDVHPGDDATVTATLENVGSANADAVSVRLDGPEALDIKANTQTQVVSELKPKQTASLTYSLFVPKTSPAQAYPVTLHADFVDEYGNRQSVNLPATVVVRSKPQFTAQTDETHLFAGVSNVNVHFSITNTGTAAAKKLRIKLIPQFPFSTDGSERYVADLEPGASQSADFTVSVDKQASLGNYALQFQANYEDPEGQSLQDTIDVSLTVPKKDLFTAIFLDFWFAWLALILIGAYVMRGRMKKSEGKPKAKG